MISLKKLNRREAIRYLGGAGIKLNADMEALMDECEKDILSNAAPKYLYIEKDLPCEEILYGNDIKNHLSGCEKAVLMCATLGAEIDRLIRVNQVSDMARAVVLDSFASVAVEQVCGRVDELLAEKYDGYFMTFRFSPGYGDYPIELQKSFLTMLDAPRKIGLTTNESCLLVPTKSVTAVLGISSSPIERRKRGCAVCNMRDECQFRSRGEHCGF
ncbi:MAG: hypothetical protein LUF33_02040 [Clostridiales bacterium]|nr:hypothetical protein [Clostridiales bacterium]